MAPKNRHRFTLAIVEAASASYFKPCYYVDYGKLRLVQLNIKDNQETYRGFKITLVKL